MGHSTHTQKTYLYRVIKIYNILPRNITLIKSQNLFKKWCKRFNLDNNIKLCEQDDNTVVIIQQTTNTDNMNQCYLDSID